MTPQEKPIRQDKAILVQLIATRVRNGWVIDRKYNDESVSSEAVIGVGYQSLLNELVGSTIPEPVENPPEVTPVEVPPPPSENPGETPL